MLYYFHRLVFCNIEQKLIHFQNFIKEIRTDFERYELFIYVKNELADIKISFKKNYYR